MLGFDTACVEESNWRSADGLLFGENGFEKEVFERWILNAESVEVQRKQRGVASCRSETSLDSHSKKE